MTKEKTMPKTAPTREQLEQEAQTAAARAAEITAQLLEQEQTDYATRLEAQRRFDEQLVASYDRSAIEAEVKQATADLDAALRANPLVLALADYLTALRRRSHAVREHMAARNRIGLPTAPPDPGPTELATVEEYIHTAATRMAEERVSAEIADLHARRDAAGTATTKENR
jgi:hypothetical protein